MDIAAIEGRLAQIRESLLLLDEIASRGRDDFVQDAYKWNAAERQLQVAIQSPLDIGHQLLPDFNLPPPETYAEVFAQMAEVGILPDGLGQRLVDMARFRNLLVHLYLDIDLATVYDILQTRLIDLDEFSVHVVRFLRAGPDKGG